MQICICLVVVMSTIPAFVQAQSGAIRVQCVDADGKPLQEVFVTVLSLDERVEKTEKTKKDGTAVFNNIPDGIYRVMGRKPEFVPAFQEFLTIRSSTESVNLTFDPGMDKLLYFEDPSRMRRSNELIDEGEDASKGGRYADAEKALLRAVDLNPSNARALYYLGVFYTQVRNFDKAVEVLEQASRMAEMYAGVPPVEGKIDPEQYKEIRSDSQRIINNMGLIRGQLALQEKQYDKAIDAFSEASKSDPDNPEAHYQLALALTHAERFDEATAEIQKSIDLQPGEKKYTDIREQIEARIDNLAIQKAQESFDAGNELAKAGNAAEALARYREALTQLPEDQHAFIWREIGKVQADAGRTAEAAEALTKAAELAPAADAPAYWTALAQVYLDAGKFDEALGALTDPRAVKPGESVEKILLDLFEKTRNREPKLAEAALERVIRHNPANSEVHFELGQMYYADGKEMDGRTKELLTKYIAIGQDSDKISQARDMMIIINRRSQ